MFPVEEINTIVAQIGPLDSDIFSIARIADSEWVIEYEPGIVELEYDISRGHLLLQTEIGAVPEEQKAKLHAVMLSVSFLWRESGGLHLALAGSEGAAVLMVALAGDELNKETIATVAGNLVERALVWRGIFATAADMVQVDSDREPQLDQIFMRV